MEKIDLADVLTNILSNAKQDNIMDYLNEHPEELEHLEPLKKIMEYLCSRMCKKLHY